MDRTPIGEKGFTLTEILIALFLVALVGIALGNFNFMAQQVLDRSHRRLWVNQEPRRLLDWMGEDAKQASTINVYNDVWGTPPVGNGTTGNRVEFQYLEDNDNTPLDSSDDALHEVQYVWTTGLSQPPPNSPAAWNDTTPGLIRRFERVTNLPAAPGSWNTNDIAAGLKTPGPGNPPPTVAITQFRVTERTAPNTSSLAPAPENVLEVTVEASRGSERVQATYYLQSRALHAWQRLHQFLLAFLRRDS